jgi:hypothetical protein
MHRVHTVLKHVHAAGQESAPTAAAASAAKPETARLWAVDSQIQSADGLRSMAQLPPKLLTDTQIVEFIKSGFVVLPLNELSADFHAQCADSIMEPWERNGRNNNWIGNNIYPGNANLGSVLATPTVRGALTSVLGPDYAMHLHRALHVSGGNDQGFHKDTPEGGGPVRHMRPRWAMIMYYPAGSTVDMGPTCILPGGQYLSQRAPYSIMCHARATIYILERAVIPRGDSSV